MPDRYTAQMTKRLVDIDDTLLARARELLGADTMKETVNRALSEVIDLERRRLLIDRMTTGDGINLDEETMRDAWR